MRFSGENCVVQDKAGKCADCGDGDRNDPCGHNPAHRPPLDRLGPFRCSHTHDGTGVFFSRNFLIL